MVPEVSLCRNIERFSPDHGKFSLFSHSDRQKKKKKCFSHHCEAPFEAFEFEPHRVRAAMRVCLQQRGAVGMSARTSHWSKKEEASEDGLVLGGSKGPGSHLGPDKRTWQISKWSPMYYISVRTPSAFPPTLHFHLWHGHIDLKERRGAGREGRWVSVGVIMRPIQCSRWGD